MIGTFYSIVTDIGAAKMLERTQQKEKLQLSQFAVGDGGGQYYEPTADMNALLNEVWRADIHSCKISNDNKNVLIVDSVIPADVGGFTIREMAIFDVEGDMIAICNTPDTQKVRVSDGVVHELAISMEILMSNTDHIELLVNPNVVSVTKEDLEVHEQKSIHDSDGVHGMRIMDGALQYLDGEKWEDIVSDEIVTEEEVASMVDGTYTPGQHSSSGSGSHSGGTPDDDDDIASDEDIAEILNGLYS